MLTTIDEIRDTIISKYDPDRIILFGSRATGSATETSDIDLLILKDTTDRPLDRRIQVETLLADRAILTRKPGAEPIPAQPPLAAWHAPDSWVRGLIAALALIVVPGETARFIGWNIAILFAVLYLAQGAAIVEHYLRKTGIKSFGRVLILVLILIMPSIVFVIALGIVDIWADFRKVRVHVTNS